MKTEDDPRLREILDQAAELPPEQRAAFLDRVCAGDAKLRAGVESLLVSLDSAGGFLRDPTIAPESLESQVFPDSPRSERAGERIGRYKLLQLIGEGGFGSVFMAEQQTPVVRKVALKIIKLGMDSAAIIARFEAERQALAMMDHPNIAKVLDAGTTESGRPYFVMELVQGIPINEYCDRKRLTPRQRIELFVPVCRAVQHAHQKGIIHRDLKPSNILVMNYDGQPVPKVIDFGVAKALNQRLTEKTLFTQFGHAVGTPEYMSPEQAEMDVLGADTRSDIYSLGALLYELLTGVTPLDRAKLREAGYAQMLRIIREEEPLKPSTRLTHSGDALANISSSRGTNPAELTRMTAGDLDWIVMKCLEKDRARRYETADGLARDLERYLRDEAVEASPPSTSDRLRRFARKHRVGISVATTIVLILLLATAISIWQAVRATRATAMKDVEKLRADQQTHAANAARHAAELNLADAMIAQADALRGDGQPRAAKEKYRQAIGLLRSIGQPLLPAKIALWDAERQSPSPLLEFHAHEGEVTHLRFFPDGSKFATVGQDGIARIWETQTGRSIRDYRGLGDAQRLSISPDGTVIAFASTSTGVTIWDTNNGKLVRTITGFSGRASAVAFSPNGQRLIVGTADKPYELCLFDANSGTLIHKFLGHEAAIRDVAFTPDGTKGVSCDGWPPGSTEGYPIKDALRAWDLESGTMLWSQSADSEERLIGALAISPSGDKVVCTAWDGIAKVCDIATGKVVGTVGCAYGARGTVGVGYSQDGGLLATAAKGGSIYIAYRGKDDWDSIHGRMNWQFAGHAGETRAVQVSPDGNVLVSGGSDGFVRLWPIYAGGAMRVLPSFLTGKETNEIFGAVISSDARRVLTSREGVRLWDEATGVITSSAEMTRHGDVGAVFGPGERSIALIEAWGPIGVWDLVLHQRLYGVEPPAGHKFNTLALSPDGNTLLADLADGHEMVVYDLRSHRPIKHLTFGPAMRIRFSPDGTFAVGISERDNLMKIWGTADWREWHSLPTGRAIRISISFDSQRVACSGSDIRVYEARSGKLLNRFDEAAIGTGVSFLPDGHLVTVGMPPEPLVLWDLDKNARVRSFWTGAFVFDLETARDGTLLVCQRVARGALNIVRFDSLDRWDELAPKAELARQRLQDEPNDPRALVTLAEWYASREMSEWAIQLVHRAGDPAEAAKLVELCRGRIAAEDPAPRRSLHNEYFVKARIDAKSRQIQMNVRDASLLAERGELYARIGHFREAADDYAKAIELVPENHHYWHEGLVPLLLQLGDEDGFRRWRTRELRQFKTTIDLDAAHRVAKDAFMYPVDGDELQIASDLADRALADPNPGWGFQSKGMAEYRRGNYQQAITWLSKSAGVWDWVYTKTVSDLVIAMSYEHLNNHAQAKTTLERAAQRMDSEFAKAGADEINDFQDWILCQVLRREAVALINGGKEPTTKPAAAATVSQ